VGGLFCLFFQVSGKEFGSLCLRFLIAAFGFATIAMAQSAPTIMARLR